MNQEEWISAAEARTRLGVRAQTLYAYASRGHVQARAHPDDSRRSLYRAIDVDSLAAKKGRSRKLADVASAAIAWGEPVLASAITTVRDGRLYYRGMMLRDWRMTSHLKRLPGYCWGPMNRSSRLKCDRSR